MEIKYEENEDGSKTMLVYLKRLMSKSEIKEELSKLNFRGTYKFFNLYGDIVYEELEDVNLDSDLFIERLNFMSQILLFLSIVMILLLTAFILIKYYI